MQRKDHQFDDIDLKIINKLQENAKMTYADIGKDLFVSPGTVHARIKKMTSAGVITHFQIKIDERKLGYDITAYLGVYLSKSNMFQNVQKALLEIPEIISADYTTGVYSLFLKIRCFDTAHLKRVISEKIQIIEGIQRTETFISLESFIDRPLEV